jgi:hypothetical protein
MELTTALSFAFGRRVSLPCHTCQLSWGQT